MAQAADTTKPEIIDMTTGVPSIGQLFTVKAYVTDDVEIDIVRLYVYFEIPGGVNTPEHIVMSDDIASYTGTPPPPGPDFHATLIVPDNAITMFYTISAGDTSENWNITDVLSRDVKDNENPSAVCPSIINTETSYQYIFNSTGSSDNVAIVNYTWTFDDDIGLVILYGEAPYFNFTDVGSFSGSLEVMDAYDNVGICFFQITITDAEAPVADTGIDQFVIVEELMAFDGSDSTDNVGIDEYTWTFVHNGTSVTLNGQNPEFRFWEVGEYEVILNVTDAADNSDQADFTIYVLNDPNVSEEFPWWTFALVTMVLAVIVTSVFILRSSKEEK
ncbi:MAG: PKD domain-containing protein [Thermoplasmata archaeon]|nr:PKD domain-containing protein [Thermoplasmata archaeon]